MSGMFRFKGRHILYYTGESSDSDIKVEVGKVPKKNAAPSAAQETPTPELTAEGADSLSAEQMAVVLGSMSDNRITDSVKDIVASAEAS